MSIIYGNTSTSHRSYIFWRIKTKAFSSIFWQISQYRCTENISHIVELVQKRCNSIANALELSLPYTNLFICSNLMLTNVQEILPLWIEIVPPIFSGKLTNGEIDYIACLPNQLNTWHLPSIYQPAFDKHRVWGLFQDLFDKLLKLRTFPVLKDPW